MAEVLKMQGPNYCYDRRPNKRWTAELRFADFYEVEFFRNESGLSRTEFIKMLVSYKYGTNFDN